MSQRVKKELGDPYMNQCISIQRRDASLPVKVL